MQVQRFRKETVRAALADVRQTLGPDALVISTSLVPARGWRRLAGHREVEVTAALPSALSENRQDAPTSRPADIASAVAEPARPVVVPTPGHEVIARLCASGVDRSLAAEVAAALPAKVMRDPSRQMLLDALAGRLASLAAGEETLAPVEVFVGPPGAGKTTTIAKLAAQTRARNGRVTLIGADGYRVGAIEQLRQYAEILNAPFLVARTSSDLERALAQGKRPMLVDTAGRSPADRGVRDLFDALSGRPDVRTHLVLAAGTPARDAERILLRYADARPTRVVLTKIDETESLAPLVRVVREAGLAVSWLGYGQRVPEDLCRATSSLLARAVTGELPLTGTDAPQMSGMREVACA
jgi:flagellar biosynthesis protein FlhF